MIMFFSDIVLGKSRYERNFLSVEIDRCHLYGFKTSYLVYKFG